jgi:hypothetical protein
MYYATIQCPAVRSIRDRRIGKRLRLTSYRKELSQRSGVTSIGKIWEAKMPIILWFLGVPLGLIVVLYLLHVF